MSARVARGKVGVMKRDLLRLFTACGVATILVSPGRGWAEAPAAAVSVFDSYVRVVEGRLADQHRSQDGFLAGEAGEPQGWARLRRGEVLVEQVTPPAGAELPGAMLHHWRGTAFAPGAKAADFEQMLRDFDGYSGYFAPQVIAAKTIAADGDRVEGWMRVRQKHVITVVMDSTDDVQFGRLDARDGWSASRSMRIAEVDGAGTSSERELSSQGGARILVADEYVLELGGTRWRGGSAGGVGLADAGDSGGAGMGGAAVCREHSAGVAGVHPEGSL